LSTKCCPLSGWPICYTSPSCRQEMLFSDWKEGRYILSLSATHNISHLVLWVIGARSSRKKRHCGYLHHQQLWAHHFVLEHSYFPKYRRLTLYIYIGDSNDSEKLSYYVRFIYNERPNYNHFRSCLRINLFTLSPCDFHFNIKTLVGSVTPLDPLYTLAWLSTYTCWTYHLLKK
jgi:hypothetical protein